MSTKRHSQYLKLSLSDTKAPTSSKTLSSPNDLGERQSLLMLNYFESVNSRIQHLIATLLYSSNKTRMENPEVLATRAQ